MIVGALKPYEQGTALLHVILNDSGRLSSGITLNRIVLIDHPF